MKRTITNKEGLPGSIYNAVCNDTYTGGGDISVTKLISPPRIVALRKKHEGEIVEDASDRIWSLLGQSVHSVIERAALGDSNIVAEERLFMPFKGIPINESKTWDWELSGQHDIYERREKCITDVKVTSIWSLQFGEKPEWDQQLNLQAMLHRYHKTPVEKVQIVAILRDHSRAKAKHDKTYPYLNVKRVEFPVWEYDRQVAFATQRIKLHQETQKQFKISGYDPEATPLCTDEERWYRGAVWAVKKKTMKNGVTNKKADRLFEKEADARQYMIDTASSLPKGKSYAPLEFRPGENKRCLEWCDVAVFCPFGRKLLEEQAELEKVVKLPESLLSADEDETSS